MNSSSSDLHCWVIWVSEKGNRIEAAAGVKNYLNWFTLFTRHLACLTVSDIIAIILFFHQQSVLQLNMIVLCFPWWWWTMSLCAWFIPRPELTDLSLCITHTFTTHFIISTDIGQLFLRPYCQAFFYLMEVALKQSEPSNKACWVSIFHDFMNSLRCRLSEVLCNAQESSTLHTHLADQHLDTNHQQQRIVTQQWLLRREEIFLDKNLLRSAAVVKTCQPK